MPRRHKSKRFAFPGSAITIEDQAVLSKSLRDYKTELDQAKRLLQEKSKLRRRGKINTDVEKCTLPEIGVLLGGLRYDRKLKRKNKTN
jgi:hypothetical protein